MPQIDMTQYASSDKTLDRFDELVRIVAALRGEDGCPWDKEQTHQSIAKNMIEEAYEAVEAIEADETDNLREELGDVLLQVLLHAQIASDEDEFTLDEVIEGISKKLISRHPHVFGSEASFAAAGFTDEEVALIQNAQDPESTLKLWDQIKSVEHARKTAQGGSDAALDSLLASVPKSQPALMQAQNISRKAAAQGFEWEDIEGLTDKLAEEFEEFADTESGSPEAEEEFGDILFTLVNVARWYNIDAESALRKSCEKFRTRWTVMEQTAEREGFKLQELVEEEWDDLWSEAKGS